MCNVYNFILTVLNIYKMLAVFSQDLLIPC